MEFEKTPQIQEVGIRYGFTPRDQSTCWYQNNITQKPN